MFKMSVETENRSELKARILSLIKIKGSITFEELARELGWSGDKRPLRSVIAELIREGFIVKTADYNRRRLVYRVNEDRRSD